jgi:hypothetical protein
LRQEKTEKGAGVSTHPEENTTSAARVTGVLAALTHIDGVGFHGIATNLTGPAPKIDRNWAGLVRNALIAVLATDWPDELQAAVERFSAAAEPVVAAQSRRDTTAASNTAQELHVAYHALSDAGWSYLAKIAGVPEQDKAHHHPGAAH